MSPAIAPPRAPFEITPEQEEIQRVCRDFAAREIRPVSLEVDEADREPPHRCAGIGNLITSNGFFTEPVLALGSEEQQRRWLDPELVGEVLTVIRELSESGMTMVISTHEMGFARQIADRVCFMSDGVILEQGPPDFIFHVRRHERTASFLKRVIEAGRAADLAAEV
jgi:ABC-type arginine transport system ATPase subunit